MDSQVQFRSICRKNGLDLSDAQIELLSKYVALMLEWNGRINLISRKDSENIWTRHILGSLSLLFTHRFPEKSSIIDIGTGGGLPGIPLAIVYPSSSLLLMDSIRKKITAVSAMIAEMPLPNATAVAARAEEVAHTPAYKGRYDYVVARAVAPVVDLIKWCRPFLKPSNPASPADPLPEKGPTLIPPGSIVLLKGGELEAEISAASVRFPGVKIDSVSLVVDGVGPDDLSDKKLLIIRVPAP
jgi:16S rRNA (guanine527-N7)-methyltransferase